MRNVTFRSMKGHGLPRGAAETTGIAEIAKIAVIASIASIPAITAIMAI